MSARKTTARKTTAAPAAPAAAETRPQGISEAVATVGAVVQTLATLDALFNRRSRSADVVRSAGIANGDHPDIVREKLLALPPQPGEEE